MAERSISARLVLKVAEFIAGGNAAKRTLSDLNSKFVETAGFAAGFRKKLDDAFKKLPKIEIDANSTPAEVKVAELRRKLEELRDKRVGVDINATAALAEMHLIQRELASIDDRDVSFDVRAGISGAMAELAAIDSEIGRLDGRTANVNVDADISGALRGFAAVAAAGAALAAAPIIVTVGASAVGLGAAFGAAGAGAGAFGLAAMGPLSRVNEALKEQENAAGGAGGAMKSLGQKSAEAAQNSLKLAQAQERVRKAEESVKDASRGVVQAREDVRKAEDDVARAASDGAARVAAAVRQVANAESSYTAAVKDAQRAQEALNVARRDAARDLEDLGNRLTDTQIAQRSAALGLKDAQKQLNAVQGNKRATADDVERASIAYAEAQQRVKELATDVQRLTVDKADADKKGVEGSDQVRAAQDQVSAANQRIVDSQQAIADAQADVARAQVDSARSVADAQDRVTAAQEKLLDSQRRYQDAQRDAILAEKQLKVEKLQQAAATSAAGAAAGGAATKMSKLTDAEQKLAAHLKGAKDDYKKWQESLEKDVFPAITGGVDLVISQLPRISPLVKTAGKAFVGLEEDAKKALKGPFWDEFLSDLNTAMPKAIEGFGKTAGNVFTGIAGVVDAVLPHTGDLVDAIVSGSKKFADWGKSLKDSPGFNEFVTFVKTHAPEVKQLIEDVATSAGHIVSALMPFGVASLGGLQLLASITAGMSPEHIQDIAVAITAIYAGFKAKQGADAAIGFLSNLKTKIGDVGTASGGVKGKLGTLAGMLGGGGIFGVAIGAGIAALGLFGDAQDDAKQKVDDLASALDQQTGAITKQAKDIIKGSLIDSGAIDAAKKMGLSLKTVTDAAMGNQGAINQVNAALEKAKTNIVVYGGKAGQGAIAQKQLTGGALALSDAINGQNKTLDGARQKLSDLAAMDGKVLGGQQLLNDSYKAAKDALDKSNGSLDLSTAKTDAQRDAIVKAREKFGDYITSVSGLADKQATLTGKTGDASAAVAAQLPKLFELAGKSKEARDRVYELAQKYGISRTEADKATTGAKNLKEVIDKLKGKSIPIEADTSKARAAFNKLISDMKSAALVGVTIGLTAAKKTAMGGIDRYAAGGLRGSMAPQMANKPTVLFGEGSSGTGATEAFIPYERRFRSRAEQLLQQVASDFGFRMIPDSVLAAATQAGSVSELLSSSSDQIMAGLGLASTTLTDTLGSTGSVTTSIIDLDKSTSGLSTTVGKSAKDLQIGVAVSTTALKSTVTSTTAAMSKTIANLKSEIVKLEAALAKAKSTTSTSSSSKSIGTAASTTAKKSSTVAGTITRTTEPIKKSKPQIGTAVSVVAQPNLIEGSQAGGATSTLNPSNASVSIEMNGTVIREEADIDRLSERLLFKARTRR